MMERGSGCLIYFNDLIIKKKQIPKTIPVAGSQKTGSPCEITSLILGQFQPQQHPLPACGSVVRNTLFCINPGKVHLPFQTATFMSFIQGQVESSPYVHLSLSFVQILYFLNSLGIFKFTINILTFFFVDKSINSFLCWNTHTIAF